MINLFGADYPWSLEYIDEYVTKRLINGAELTICKDGTAWINKWTSRPMQIHLFIAQMYIATGLVGEDSGNLETGERHYTFYMGTVKDHLDRKQ